MSLLKRVYVGAVRAVKVPLAGSGILGMLEKRPGRLSRWARSLFAIYDIDDMIRLDLAWWTFDALEQVDAFLRARPGARVFEYGAGASTMWLSRRAGQVTFVEHDEGWMQLVKDRAKGRGNVEGMFRPPEAATGGADAAYGSGKPGYAGKTFRAYVEAIDSVPGDFDVVVVDGRCRPQCLLAALRRVKPGGLIIYDNSGRRRYRPGIEAVDKRRVVTSGLTACLPYGDQTTLIFV